MEDVAARLTSRFGPSAQDWPATIPAVTARLASAWGFTPGELFESGASSVIMRCQWPDGTPAVLKLSPDQPLLAKQAEMLRLFAPTGRVPAVLAADEDTGAMALAEVLPGTEAENLPPDSLPQQWGELLAALHSVAPPAHWPLHLRGRLDEAFARIGRRLTDPTIAARIDAATWQRAKDRCATLLDAQSPVVLLHGDLHLGNALDGGPSRGLIAIDPKACIGDPCFDARRLRPGRRRQGRHRRPLPPRRHRLRPRRRPAPRLGQGDRPDDRHRPPHVRRPSTGDRRTADAHQLKAA